MQISFSYKKKKSVLDMNIPTEVMTGQAFGNPSSIS